MGDHVHASLKDFLSVVPVEGRTTERLESLLREKWKRNRKGFNDLHEEKRWGGKALAQVRWFAQNQDVCTIPFMVEQFHKVELSPNITLIGKIDRVDQEADSGLHVIDYKTGKMPEEIGQVQLYLYALILCKEQDLPVNKASYLYLSPGAFRTLRPTHADLDQAASYIVEMVEKIRAEAEYPATPNQYCVTCDFLEICPEKEKLVGLSVDEWELDF